MSICCAFDMYEFLDNNSTVQQALFLLQTNRFLELKIPCLILWQGHNFTDLTEVYMTGVTCEAGNADFPENLVSLLAVFQWFNSLQWRARNINLHPAKMSCYTIYFWKVTFRNIPILLSNVVVGLVISYDKNVNEQCELMAEIEWSTTGMNLKPVTNN